MAEDGLVDAGEPGTRARKVYTINDRGRQAFTEWLSQPPGNETIRFPLLLTLAFGQHVPPHQPASVLARHRIIHTDRTAYRCQREQMPPGYEEADPYAVATLQFGIRYEETVLAWFDELPASLTSPS